MQFCHYGDDQSSISRRACRTACLGGVLDELNKGILEGASPPEVGRDSF